MWTVDFNPAIGSAVGKKRPALIVSPDEANSALRTVVVVPLFSTIKGWPSRVKVQVRRRPGGAALDQIRAIDKSRLARKTASLTPAEAKEMSDRLVEMFKP